MTEETFEAICAILDAPARMYERGEVIPRWEAGMPIRWHIMKRGRAYIFESRPNREQLKDAEYFDTYFGFRERKRQTDAT